MLNLSDYANEYIDFADYIGTGTPKTYAMRDAICFQDGDGHLSKTDSIDSPEMAIVEWLSHFAKLAQVEESNGLLWGFAATLLENLRSECG